MADDTITHILERTWVEIQAKEAQRQQRPDLIVLTQPQHTLAIGEAQVVAAGSLLCSISGKGQLQLSRLVQGQFLTKEVLAVGTNVALQAVALDDENVLVLVVGYAGLIRIWGVPLHGVALLLFAGNAMLEDVAAVTDKAACDVDSAHSSALPTAKLSSDGHTLILLGPDGHGRVCRVPLPLWLESLNLNNAVNSGETSGSNVLGQLAGIPFTLPLSRSAAVHLAIAPAIAPNSPVLQL